MPTNQSLQAIAIILSLIVVFSLVKNCHAQAGSPAPDPIHTQIEKEKYIPPFPLPTNIENEHGIKKDNPETGPILEDDTSGMAEEEYKWCVNRYSAEYGYQKNFIQPLCANVSYLYVSLHESIKFLHQLIKNSLML